jgi:hypothetical protein
MTTSGAPGDRPAVEALERGADAARRTGHENASVHDVSSTRPDETSTTLAG